MRQTALLPTGKNVMMLQCSPLSESKYWPGNHRGQSARSRSVPHVRIQDRRYPVGFRGDGQVGLAYTARDPFGVEVTEL
ncbi:hypothetical protein FM21_26080 [Streptomyces mutabilis]|uniref:Uncharacterized protein n=1 Tax=Streptomyces mutabilis TaxID=67332 RepID=A0A086MZC0_9ACTN|nr:hypothetical protein FM21_26080 [Streptomyces mutabilis]